MSTVLTFEQAKPFIYADLASNLTPALMGPPGIGKSSLVEGLAREFKTEVFVLAVNQLGDRADLTGVRPTKDEKTGKWRQTSFPHSVIMQAIEYAEEHQDEHPMLFMDEFNRASSDITSAILSFQTLRSIGDVKFPDNLRIVVAGNDKGNVTSLDEASISRFSVYHVRPDLETYMSIQKLNPFVQAVLSKYPDDLTAKPVNRNTTASPDATPDDDDSDDVMDYGYMAEELSKQITCPRTITATSNWLDTFGLVKNGSDKEKDLLGLMFSEMGENGENNILLAAIDAHVGETSFADHLFDEINMYYNSMLSSTHVSAQPILSGLRPKQDVINNLHRTTTVQEVENLIASMPEKDRMTTLVWLSELSSSKEVNNKQAVDSFMTSAPYQIKQFDGEAIRNLMTVLPYADRISESAVKALLSSNAQSLEPMRVTIQSITGLS